MTARPSLLYVARTTWSLFLALGLVMAGNGLQGVLIGVRTQVEGFGGATTGLIIAGYYLGFLVGSWYIPRVLAAVGHIRVFVGLASLASAVVLVHAIWVTPLVWLALRAVTGVAMAGLYVTVESWLNAQATNETRGRTLSLYMLVLTGGLIAGQGLVGVGSVRGFLLFILSSLLVSLAVVPLALSPVPLPSSEMPESLRLRELYRLAPLGVITGFLTGASTGGFIGMTAVWATSIGLSPGRAGFYTGMGLLGSIVLQFPLGSLSDRLPRRRVIFGVAVGAVLVAVWGTTFEPRSFAMIATFFMYGALAYPMYSLAASHINDAVPAAKAVAAASGFVFTTGLGAVFGPLTISLLTELLGADGFFWSLALFFLPVAVFSLWRVANWVAPIQRPYIPMPARSTALLLGIAVRSGHDEEQRP